MFSESACLVRRVGCKLRGEVSEREIRLGALGRG